MERKGNGYLPEMEHESSLVEDRSFLVFSVYDIQQMQMVLLQLWPKDQDSKNKKSIN